jgi:hypothetical protein
MNNAFFISCSKLNGKAFIVVTLNKFNCSVRLQSYGTAQ